MEFLSVAGRFGRVMTEPRGPGFLRGRLALNVEASPVFLIFQERSTYGFNGVVQGRHYLEVGARVTPFISLGFGFLVTDKQTPPGTARLNFTPQVGGGIAIQGTEDRVFTVEYRLHHISNGSRANRNPGVNSSVFQFGISFPLRKPISE